MPISRTELRALKEAAKKGVVSTEYSLFVIVESVGTRVEAKPWLAGSVSQLRDKGNRLR